MLIDVLKQFYPDEYEMLNCLALNDISTFNFFANEDYSFIKHLMGYGIICDNDGVYDFRIDAIRDYIQKKNNSKIMLVSLEDKWGNICNRRGLLEMELRKIVKQVLIIALKGKENAKTYVVNKIYGDSKNKYATHSYDDLFDPKKSAIYLKNLSTIIKGNWDFFSTFISPLNQDDFIFAMNVLNQEGRFDAHAKIPSNDDMVLFNAAVDKIYGIVDRYKEIYDN